MFDKQFQMSAHSGMLARFVQGTPGVMRLLEIWMKRLLLLSLLIATSAVAATGPYNPESDANGEVTHALAEAAANHKPVLLFFGANWCANCRALAKSLEAGKNPELMAAHFNVACAPRTNFNHRARSARYTAFSSRRSRACMRGRPSNSRNAKPCCRHGDGKV